MPGCEAPHSRSRPAPPFVDLPAGRDDEAVAEIHLRLLEEVGVTRRPVPGTNVVPQAVGTATSNSRVESGDAGDARTYRDIEVRIGASPIGAQKAVATVPRYGNDVDSVRAKG